MHSISSNKKVPQERSVLHDVGSIMRLVDDRFEIDSEGSRFTARRAVSCLVQPEAGDHVLFGGSSAGELFVLAVLERPSGAEIRLCPEGDMSIEMKSGRFAVTATDGLDLISKKSISLTSPLVEVRSTTSRILSRGLEVVGGTMFAQLDSVKTVSSKLERIAESVVDRFKRSYRYIDEVEHTRAGQLDYVANRSLRLKGENAFLHAEKLVKLDAEQIHLG